MIRQVKQLDSSLEARGAEYLVLGRLLIEGIPAFKCDDGAAGYDLVATNPDRSTSCRIQVKSRWATDANGGVFIKNFASEFLVYVALNRGNRYGPQAKRGADKREPDFYVIPTRLVMAMPRTKADLVYVLKHLPKPAEFLDRFDNIARRLASQRRCGRRNKP